MLKQQQEAEQILKWLKKMMGDAVGSNVCQPDGAGMIHADVIMSSASAHVFSYRPYSLEVHYRQSWSTWSLSSLSIFFIIHSSMVFIVCHCFSCACHVFLHLFTHVQDQLVHCSESFRQCSVHSSDSIEWSDCICADLPCQSDKSPDIMAIDLTNAFNASQVFKMLMEIIMESLESEEKFVLCRFVPGGPDFSDHHGHRWDLCRRPEKTNRHPTLLHGCVWK